MNEDIAHIAFRLVNSAHGVLFVDRRKLVSLLEQNSIEVSRFL